MLFQIIAVIVLLVFYSCYFIKMINQGKKGIQTNQMGKGKTGIVRRIEITMKAATYIVPVVEMISIVLHTTNFPNWIRCTGMIIAILGDVIFLCAVITMRDSWRAGVPETDETELVTNGIFQISRNPAFLGFDLVYLGILLMFFNWILLVASVFAAGMFHIQIVKVEEVFLEDTFGDAYRNYMESVHRYFGKKNRV